MEFRHLPMAGGLYDQNPLMLDRFMHIFNELNLQRQKEEAEKSRRQGGPAPHVKGPTKRPMR